jgi:hypothetical protein
VKKSLKFAVGGALLCALALGSPVGANAVGETITVLSPTVTAGSTANALGVTLSGFNSGSSYIAVVSASAGFLSLGSSAGVTALVGYSALDTVSETLGFEGGYSDVAAALASITFDAPSSAGDATVEITLSESATSANPLFFNPANGHYYEYVAVGSGDIAWAEAQTAASGMSLLGMTGYLATITDSAENEFVANKTSAVNVWIGAARSNAGIDGTYASLNNTSDPAGLVWEWKTGPEAGTDFYQQTAWNVGGGSGIGGAFASWESVRDTEPNNYQYFEAPGWHEGFAVTNWNGSKGWWNDLPNTPLGEDVVPGYLVEYGGIGTSVASEASQTATVTVSEAGPTDGGAGSGGEESLSLTGLSPEQQFAAGLFAAGIFALSLASFSGRRRLHQLAIDNRVSETLKRLDARLTRMENRFRRSRRRG